MNIRKNYEKERVNKKYRGPVSIESTNSYHNQGILLPISIVIIDRARVEGSLSCFQGQHLSDQ